MRRGVGRPGKRTRYGYDYQQSPGKQLEEVLQLTDKRDEYEEVISYLAAAVEEHINVTKIASKQKEEESLIKEKLLEAFPHLFPDDDTRDKKMHFVHKWISKKHTQTRYLVKRRDLQSDRGRTTLARVQSSRKIFTTVSDKKDNGKSRVRAASIAANDENTFQAQSQGASSSLTLNRSQITDHSHYLHNYPSYPSSSAEEPTEGASSQNPMFYFLDSCIPSMAHHIQAFLDFRCDNAEYLLAVSTWSPNMIERFLDRLPPNANGERLNEMEKQTLVNHFLTYFQDK